MLACALAGCGGYWVVRWPQRTLWASSVKPAPEIQPESLLANLPLDSVGRAERGGVRATLELLDAPRSQALFQAHLQQHRVQPALLAVENASATSYLFNKANLAKDYVPASETGAWACEHPSLTVARHARWLLLFLPGLLMQTVIEPASTLDFPKFEELVSRPEGSGCRTVQEAFSRAEIADGLLSPGEARQGVLFLRPVPLGQALALTLIDPDTQETLVLELPTPPPVQTVSRQYAAPPEAVWTAVTDAVRATSWSLLSSDQAAGTLTARTGFRILGWDTRSRFAVSVAPVDAAKTEVAIESTLRGRDSTALGRYSQTVDDVLATLDGKLAAPKPEPILEDLEAEIPLEAETPPLIQTNVLPSGDPVGVE
jgi:hypothetical protein